MKKSGKYDKITGVGSISIGIGLILSIINNYFQTLAWIGIILIIFVTYKKWGDTNR